ncbi:hypothetical protein D3C87_891560 [compost metagenome]
MKLYNVKNKFSAYSLVEYIVYANSESEAVSIAGDKLKKYALEQNHSIDKKMFDLFGLKVIDIFEFMDKPDYHDYFRIKCLSENIQEEQIAQISYF